MFLCAAKLALPGQLQRKDYFLSRLRNPLVHVLEPKPNPVAEFSSNNEVSLSTTRSNRLLSTHNG